MVILHTVPVAYTSKRDVLEMNSHLDLPKCYFERVLPELFKTLSTSCAFRVLHEVSMHLEPRVYNVAFPGLVERVDCGLCTK